VNNKGNGKTCNRAHIGECDTVVAEVLPEGKVAALRSCKRQGTRSPFVEGMASMNAPALAVSTSGLPLAPAPDVAIESSRRVLMSGRSARCWSTAAAHQSQPQQWQYPVRTLAPLRCIYTEFSFAACRCRHSLLCPLLVCCVAGACALLRCNSSKRVWSLFNALRSAVGRRGFRQRP